MNTREKTNAACGKTIAVIAEFNPLHMGHAWFLSEARRLAGAGNVIVLMSGDFVQRGEPAILDKYTRAEMALLSGADLVLELPAACAASGARRFAEGAAVILNALGCVDELWFGSEAGRIEPFLALTEQLADESPAFSASLQAHLAAGLSFPAARAAALTEVQDREQNKGTVPSSVTQDSGDVLLCGTSVSDFLSRPNNILGLEYTLALARSGARIRPRTLVRAGSGYHDESLHGSLASATALRRALLSCPGGDAAAGGTEANAKASNRSGDPGEKLLTDPEAALAALKGQIPEAAEAPLAAALARSVLMTADDFSPMLHYQLLRENRESLCRYLDLPRDLASRIINLLPEFRSWTQFAALIKTRNITRSQADRALLHVLLSLTPENLAHAMHPAAARLLGFRKEALPLLSAIKKNGSLPLAAGAADLPDMTGDLFASNLYEARCAALSGRPFVHEYSREVLRL